jgi:hypothetical protein
LNSIQSALQSGNITNAQHAFAAFEQEVQKATATGAKTIFAPGTQQSKDLQLLGNALKSADLNGAQTAFATLKQDINSVTQLTNHSSSSSSSARSLSGAGRISNGPSHVAGSILNFRA